MEDVVVWWVAGWAGVGRNVRKIPQVQEGQWQKKPSGHAAEEAVRVHTVAIPPTPLNGAIISGLAMNSVRGSGNTCSCSLFCSAFGF